MSQNLTHFPIIEGMEVCAARLGAPLMIIKALKKSGSLAFRKAGRIDTGILIPELFRELATASAIPEGMGSPQDWLTTEKAKRETIKRKADEGSLMATEDAKRQNGEAWAFIFSELERLCVEAPPDYAGRSAVEIHARLTKFKEAMRVDGKRRFEEAA